jgi:CubicO group peptidase (beta-lactamase class C family)
MVVALCLAGVSVPARQASVPDFSGLEAVIRKELQETQTPGAAIAVVMGDRVVYTRGFGIANGETGELVRPEMLFRLGSTTKMFTAASVILLAEQGKLTLTEPIGTHIRGLTPKLAALTAQQLLSHTSGILDEAPMFGSHDDAAMSAEVARWTDTRFFAEPGQIYSYSNPGYWLAGLLAETVGGKPFADQVATTIFEPLGMSRSTFRPTLAMTYPLAQGHELFGGRLQIIRPAANNAASWPAGSIFSNVIDLSRWMMAFLNEGVIDGEQRLPASLFRALVTPQATIPGVAAKYGYGIRTETWRGLDLVEHTGSRAGYGSYIRMIPSRKMGVVVLANRTGVTLPRTTQAAIEAALGRLPLTDSVMGPSTLTVEQLRAFAGTYSQGAREMSVVEREGKLFLKQGSNEAPLEHQNLLSPAPPANERRFRAGSTTYIFVLNTSGAVTFLHSGGRSWRKIK